MGLRGPPAKPTLLKELQGTYRPDRSPANEPRPAVGKPKRPKHLKGVGRKAWDFFASELLELKVLTVRDGGALELLCDAYAEWTLARNAVREHGMTFEQHTQNGVTIRPRPEVRIASDAWRRMHRMLVEFGLTPAARARVNAAEPGTAGKKKGDHKGFFFGKHSRSA